MKEIPKAIIDKFSLTKTDVILQCAFLYQQYLPIFFYKPLGLPNWQIRILYVTKNKAAAWVDMSEEWCLKVEHIDYSEFVQELSRRAISKSQLPFGMVPDELGLYNLALYGQYDTRTGLIKCKPAKPSFLQRIKNIFQ